MMKHRFARAALAALCTFPGLPAISDTGASRVEFISSAAPATEEEMIVPFSSASIVVTHAGKVQEKLPLQYRALFRSGDAIGDRQAGRVNDRDGAPVMLSAPDKKGNIAQGPFYSWSPDANSLLAVHGAKSRNKEANRLFLVTHFEYHTEAPNIDPAKPPVDLYAKLPMAMNLTALDQDRKSGELAPVDLTSVDMGAVNGLWIPCAGTLTPWNSHLGGEEYEPDARHFESKPLEPMNLYLETPGKTAAEGGANPYDYGHPVEVKVDAKGKTRVAKHYAMGRIAFELADIMPDRRTAYYGDDGRDVGLFMFVADRKDDLSAGTIYAARWHQTEAAGSGAAKLEWMRLGHASDGEIASLVRRGVRFSDIFDISDQAAEGYRPVYAYAGTAGETKLAYLKLKPGMEKAAAFLETRRYAAWLGATTEFTKMEGQTHSARHRKLYTAMSYIEGGMLDGRNGERPRDDIRLGGDPKDLACGAVYESNLAAGQKDTEGRPIRSAWVAASTRALVTGAKKPAGQTGYGRYDTCDTDRVANPDNLKYSDALDTLFIGEDSGHHLNNFLWAYRPADGNLARLASAPIGAEWTGLQVAERLNGYTYLMSNVQHPGAEKDLEKYPEEVRLNLRAKVDQRGMVGYFGPFRTWGRNAH